MRHELNDIEYHHLFVSPIHNLRFSVEELIKAYEARLENLTKYISENDYNSSIYKTSRSEIFKSMDSLKIHFEIICENLKRNIEKSFDKVAESQGDK
jgi:hypothetical protein